MVIIDFQALSNKGLSLLHKDSLSVLFMLILNHVIGRSGIVLAMPIAFATYTKEAGTTNGSCFFSFYFKNATMFYRMLHFMSQKHFIFGLKGVIFMGTTQPIRNRQELQDFSSYYKQVKPHLRNYTLVVLGLNTALRISDLLNLRWRSVYDFKKNCFRDHLLVWEHKTGKRNYIAINQNAKNALYLYFMEKNPDPEEYVFSKRTNPYKPLSRSQAYRIIKEDASHTTSEEAISCHSLRKTFGYYAWKEGVQPALLMNVFNHSSFHITKRYLGIEQDEKDLVYLNINL